MALLNKKAVRAHALEAVDHITLSTGKPRFTRVSAAFLLEIESTVKDLVTVKAGSRGRKGRTL